MAFANDLIEFIKQSPTPYHTVASVKEALIADGFTELSENNPSLFSDGGKHFVVRGGSSIIAFKGKSDNGFMVCASHSDSPAFKIKNELFGGAYVRFATEKYGGMINYTWLDRPLSAAGRLVLRSADGVNTRLFDLEKPAFVIPSVAIHLNRVVNDGLKLNPAVDLLPLSGTASSKDSFATQVAKLVGVSKEDIISQDVFLYNAEEGRVIGIDDELLLSPRIDDLGCVFSSLRAFLDAPCTDKSIAVLAVFDNEEVGSETKQGAASTFLDMTLRHIAGSDEKYSSLLYNSFMVSADNAHATHPNHPELSNDKDSPILGGGVVVKFNANQKYTTDALSAGIFTVLADSANIKLQNYHNRADMPGGSTLGSISNTRVSVSTIDIGLPQLAMHSATETCAVSDIDDMVKVLTAVYSTGIKKQGDDIVVL